MIFTCGVRFMRFSLSGVTGCASGSFTAAVWRCSPDMESKRLQSCLGGVFFVVSAFFIRLNVFLYDRPSMGMSNHILDCSEDLDGEIVTEGGFTILIIFNCCTELLLCFGMK